MIETRVGWRERRPERLALEQLWITSMAFWSGKHRFWFADGRIMPFEDNVYEPNDNEVRYKVNLIRARVDAAVSKVLGVDADFQVRPPTGKARDRYNAELSNKVFAHIREVADWQMTQLNSKQWSAICGSSFVKVYWDPLVGEPDRFFWDTKQNKSVVPEVMLSQPQKIEKEQAGLFEDLPPGDIAMSVCSPFGFFYDSASRDKGIRGCHWVAERHYVDIARVAERFGVDEKDIQPVENSGGLDNYEEAIAFMSSGNGFSIFDYGRPMDKIGKRTMYVEMWERPSSHHKKGQWIVYAGGKIIRKGDNPYAADKTGWSHLPYVKDDWKPHPGRFWGASLVEDLLSPQWHLNETRSAQISFIRAHGQPAVFVGKDSGLDTDRMTSQVGRIYTINETTAVGVKMGPTPQMPAEVMNVAALTEGDLNKLASQSEIDGGKLPGELRSGSAVRAVNEERFAGLSIPAKMAVRTVRDVGRVALALAHQFYTTPRLMKYMGDDNEWVVEQFTGADLINDVVVVGEPDIGDSIAAQREEVLDALNMGAFNPQLDRQTRTMILKMLKYKTSDEFFSRSIQAEKHAEDVIGQIIRDPLKYGEIGYPVLPWQDAESEINALVSFMYTAEFDALDPRAKAVITKYWQDLSMLLQQVAMQQQAMSEAENAGKPEKGQASQPRPAQQQG